MERFRPDSLLDGLLRPFLMADPISYLYVEMMAPDLRFAGIVIGLVFLVAYSLLRRQRVCFTGAQWRMVVVLGLSFFLWTFISGNGRYFLPGLLLAGPVLALLIGRLPSPLPVRLSVLGAFSVLQVAVLIDFFQQDPWRVTAWSDGPAIAIAESNLRKEPALFLKIGSNSYSALAPHFDVQSRWVMLGPHLRRDMGSYERKKLAEAFSSGYKAFAVAPKANDIADGAGQPIADVRRAIGEVLATYGYALSSPTCETIAVTSGSSGDLMSRLATAEGFWFCPVKRVGDVVATSARVVLPRKHEQIFRIFEHACPRFFPSGGGWDSHVEGISRRYYQGTDIRLQVLDDGMVSYQYLRSINFTKVGAGEAVLRGDVTIPCDRLVGRYRPPWLRD